MPRTRTPRMPGVSRIDQPEKRTYGWYVRVHTQGKTLAKFFPDMTHGGKKKALAAAVAHRDKVAAAAAGEMGGDFGDQFLTRAGTATAGVWVVKVPGRAKPTVRKFTDKAYGGKKESREAAAKWRDAVAVNSGAGAEE